MVKSSPKDYHSWLLSNIQVWQQAGVQDACYCLTAQFFRAWFSLELKTLTVIGRQFTHVCLYSLHRTVWITWVSLVWLLHRMCWYTSPSSHQTKGKFATVSRWGYGQTDQQCQVLSCWLVWKSFGSWMTLSPKMFLDPVFDGIPFFHQ